MLRRHWFFALARVLVAWALLTVQGVCDTAQLAALSLPSVRASAQGKVSDADALHRAVCSCALCRGGKSCCCLRARSAREGMALRATCDMPDKSSVPGVPGPTRALPPTLLAVAAPLVGVLPTFTLSAFPFWQTRAEQPPTLPPSV